MSEAHIQKSPLARLVLFIICLSITGSMIAGVHYFAVDLPNQQSISKPPANWACACLNECDAKYWIGTRDGVLQNAKCTNDCFANHLC